MAFSTPLIRSFRHPARNWGFVAVFPLLANFLSASAEPSPDLAHWRAERLEGLTAPDGWLTLIGRYWLKEGAQTLGTAPTHALVLTKGPPTLGTLTWDKSKNQVVLALAPGVDATVNGGKAPEKIIFSNDEDHLTEVRLGTLTLQLISRGERKALRVRDSAAETRAHFAGLEYFPEDPSWRIEATWEAFSPPRILKIENIIGTVSPEAVPGKAVFEYKGKTYELWPIQESGENSLFFIFSDQTSGEETYGSGRFLFTDPPKDGKVVLDFNHAISPPCAFTAFATCPLPPAQNRLAIRVAAGEKKPATAAHP